MRRVSSAAVFLAAALLGPMAWAEPAAVTFRSEALGEEVTLFGVSDRGFLTDLELGVFSHLLRCRRTGRERRIDLVLARTLVRLARHFDRPVAIVSGYRAVQRHGRRRSLHLSGRAADIAVAGITPRQLRDAAVAMGVPGIGYYPASGFVHVDVRERRFWWVDYSRPGVRGEIVADPDGTAPDTPGPALRRASR